MDYGINSSLVNEVLAFSKKPQVEEHSDISNRIIIINDLNQAEQLAYEEVFGEDEYSWKDIRELEMSEVWGNYYAMMEDKRPEGLEELLEIISDNLRESSLYNDFFDDVTADLNNCAINRAINGKNCSFFEDLFKIYQIGAIPCGWEGNYPEGRIVAYKK